MLHFPVSRSRNNYEYGCQQRRHEFTSKLKLHFIVDAMVFVDLVVLSP